MRASREGAAAVRKQNRNSYAARHHRFAGGAGGHPPTVTHSRHGPRQRPRRQWRSEPFSTADSFVSKACGAFSGVIAHPPDQFKFEPLFNALRDVQSSSDFCKLRLHIVLIQFFNCTSLATLFLAAINRSIFQQVGGGERLLSGRPSPPRPPRGRLFASAVRRPSAPTPAQSAKIVSCIICCCASCLFAIRQSASARAGP